MVVGFGSALRGNVWIWRRVAKATAGGLRVRRCACVSMWGREHIIESTSLPARAYMSQLVCTVWRKCICMCAHFQTADPPSAHVDVIYAIRFPTPLKLHDVIVRQTGVIKAEEGGWRLTWRGGRYKPTIWDTLESRGWFGCVLLSDTWTELRQSESKHWQYLTL